MRNQSQHWEEFKNLIGSMLKERVLEEDGLFFLGPDHFLVAIRGDADLLDDISEDEQERKTVKEALQKTAYGRLMSHMRSIKQEIPLAYAIKPAGNDYATGRFYFTVTLTGGQGQ